MLFIETLPSRLGRYLPGVYATASAQSNIDEDQCTLRWRLHRRGARNYAKRAKRMLHRKTSSRLSGTRATTADNPPALLASVWQLMVLRIIAITGQLAAIIISTALGVALPFLPMIAVVASLILLNLMTWLRLKRRASASHYEIAGYLAFDLTAFTLLLFFSGGADNPFSLVIVLNAVLVALLLPPLPAVFAT